MADVPPDLNSNPPTPRWVKVFGIIGIVLVLLFGIIKLAGGGNHGPGRHMPSGSVPANGETLPASVTGPHIHQL